jgi:hypothetical protein
MWEYAVVFSTKPPSHRNQRGHLGGYVCGGVLSSAFCIPMLDNCRVIRRELWQECEGRDVGRLYDAEVAMVEGRDSAGVEPFGEGDDARVCAAEWEIAVSAGEFSDAGPVDMGERLDYERRR